VLKMATEKELKELYDGTKYREVIAAEDSKKLMESWRYQWPGSIADATARKLLLIAWSYHQVGDYNESIFIFKALFRKYDPSSEIYESAGRGLAQGLLQRDGNIVEADIIMKTLPSNDLKRDELRSSLFLTAARKGIVIQVEEVMAMITNALMSVPYTRVNGHIVNNCTMALHEARMQENSKSYQSILPGLMLSALAIYQATKAPENHIASAMFRVSQICEAQGWLKVAKIDADASVALWKKLRDSEGGERYQKNLEDAEAQARKFQ
jgi:hypothetical protein